MTIGNFQGNEKLTEDDHYREKVHSGYTDVDCGTGPTDFTLHYGDKFKPANVGTLRYKLIITPTSHPLYIYIAILRNRKQQFNTLRCGM
jgi:hypothetical protein